MLNENKEITVAFHTGEVSYENLTAVPLSRHWTGSLGQFLSCQIISGHHLMETEGFDTSVSISIMHTLVH